MVSVETGFREDEGVESGETIERSGEGEQEKIGFCCFQLRHFQTITNFWESEERVKEERSGRTSRGRSDIVEGTQEGT